MACVVQRRVITIYPVNRINSYQDRILKHQFMKVMKTDLLPAVLAIGATELEM